LLAAGLTVVVISPNQLKNLRGRHGFVGSKDDRFDAFVLADTLRTDRARLRPAAGAEPASGLPSPFSVSGSAAAALRSPDGAPVARRRSTRGTGK
jgi:hypothetical protein